MSLTLGETLILLERLAPLRLAEEWDNVGLLLDGGNRLDRKVRRALLTIDLTEEVLAEAIAATAELIIAYHPPLFEAAKRLTRETERERVVVDVLRHQLAVYSPHTALDSVMGGVNDWLADAFGPAERAAIIPAAEGAPAGAGAGRQVVLKQPDRLADAVTRVKRHLGLERVRVAESRAHREGRRVQRIAVCAGAGGSVLAKAPDADLYLTGEMRHHDVLGIVARGASVILCDHTPTERGYLPHYAKRIEAAAGRELEVIVAKTDADPLVVT